jgi:hypothetical protein
MTEFTKLRKQVDTAAQLLAEQQQWLLPDKILLSIQNDPVSASAEVSNHLSEITNLMRDLEEYDALCGKYVDKKEQKDEISGEFRFGPGMRSKIDSCSVLVKDTKATCVSLLNSCHDLHTVAAKRLDEIKPVEAPSAAVITDEVDRAEEMLRQQLEEQAARSAAEAELHAQAEEARFKKQFQLQQKRDYLRNVLHSANSYRSTTDLVRFLDDFRKVQHCGQFFSVSCLTVILSEGSG